MSNCDATDFDVEKILSKIPNLTQINLCNNENITLNTLIALLSRKPSMRLINMSGCQQIVTAPEPRVKVLAPELCTLIVNMNHEVVNDWEKLWLNKGTSMRWPHSLYIFKPL